MRHPRRLPLLLLAAAALATGVWGGLARMQVPLPLPDAGAGWIAHHGPLMVTGFLGTLIALERAVAVGGRWPFAVPALGGIGALALVVSPTGALGPELAATAAAGYVALSAVIVRRQAAAFTVLPLLGALCLLAGNLRWLARAEIPPATPWWIGFVVLTIVGERIELGRLRPPRRGERPAALAAAAVLGAGLLVTLVDTAWGTRLCGAGVLGLATWLLTFDVARRTIAQPGLPRFTAVCLLSGYAWLAVGGGLLLAGTPLASGLAYDAMLHAVFLGFAFAMIFGHAPLVLGAVLGVGLPFRRRFYAHVAILHAGVALRLGADLMESATWRSRGGIVAAAALVVFAASSLVAALPRRAHG